MVGCSCSGDLVGGIDLGLCAACDNPAPLLVGNVILVMLLVVVIGPMGLAECLDQLVEGRFERALAGFDFRRLGVGEHDEILVEYARQLLLEVKGRLGVDRFGFADRIAGGPCDLVEWTSNRFLDLGMAAQAGADLVPYKPGIVKSAIAKGETALLFFKSTY